MPDAGHQRLALRIAAALGTLVAPLAGRAKMWSGRERERKGERSGGERGEERRRQDKTAYFDARLVLAGLLGWGLIGRAGRGGGVAG